MRLLIKRLGLFIAAPFFIVTLYLLAALLGGLIPSSSSPQAAQSEFLEKPVYLSANALHADIAIPLNSLSLEKFDFLRDAGFPLDNPNLEYLVIGWGSRAFYTSTADYTDMKFSTIWKAATGDSAVIHVAPAGDIGKSDTAIKVTMSEEGFANMLEFILNSFEKRHASPNLLVGETFGYGDVFYEAKGRFNIFNPCNVWISQALSKADVSTGIWTPTTFSLRVHHALYH